MKIIATTKPIPEQYIKKYWRVHAPGYDTGSRFSDDFEEARTLLMIYLYSRLHVHPKYYIYAWLRNIWELLEIVEKL